MSCSQAPYYVPSGVHLEHKHRSVKEFWLRPVKTQMDGLVNDAVYWQQIT